MLFFNRYLDLIMGIIGTALSIIKSDYLIPRMGIEKYGLSIIVLIIMTLVLLSESPKKDR